MAAQDRPPASNKDLESIAQARSLASAARQAQSQLAELSQERIDAIVTAMADAVTPQAEVLARLAVDETGYGVVADKVQKNLFSSRQVYDFIKPMKTVGVVNRIEEKKIVEIGEPFGVVAAIVPSTNPTSTAIYKVLIALKARCAIVVSPHPAAVRCITRSVEIMCDAACRAGAPPGSIGWMTTVSLEGTQELMRHRDSCDRRNGARARRLQLRQTCVWCRPRQRTLLHRAHCGPEKGSQRHHDRKDVRQRCPLLFAQLGRG
jgi:acyl-CoA reductase-like NAD-dependent aldehyde dehydrogenase